MQGSVAYYCVSTDRQGQSSLGLGVQRAAVAGFVGARKQGAEFTEVESGKRNDRPQLAAALDLCRRQRAMLVIAKLERLARNVAFIANLMESGVEFTAVDMPYANKLTLHILAAVAEQRPWDGGQPMSKGEILSLSRTASIELFI
jgi:DNA invertase Pin-like site-specific DNA recombinase